MGQHENTASFFLLGLCDSSNWSRLFSQKTRSKVFNVWSHVFEHYCFRVNSHLCRIRWINRSLVYEGDSRYFT